MLTPDHCDVLLRALLAHVGLSRSPTQEICDVDGTLYITRYLLAAAPDDRADMSTRFEWPEGAAVPVPAASKGRVYLHRIHRPDHDRALHTHPWVGTSLVLSGGYREVSTTLNLGKHMSPRDGAMYWGTPPQETYYGVGEVRDLSVQTAHRISEVAPETWSLVSTNGHVSDWGFITPVSASGGRSWRYTTWRKYLQALGYQV